MTRGNFVIYSMVVVFLGEYYHHYNLVDLIDRFMEVLPTKTL